jgi:hypothetical protein
MKVYFNGWFSGFINNINPGLHVNFFLNLFEIVYGEKCESSVHINECEVLCEFDMLIGTSSLVNEKQWKHTYLFSGESTLKCNKSDYTCVLWGERNHKNVVNIPLFIPYIYTNNFVTELENKNEIKKIPNNDVCVIISNPRGKERTAFLNDLEKHFKICYAGLYKNNIGGTLKSQYNTEQYQRFVSNFKFIISMENSRKDTYITEKLINGLLSSTVPVYWGSDRVHDYINEDRFLNLSELTNTNEIIQNMKFLIDNPDKWLQKVNKHVFPNEGNKLERTMENIANDIQCVLRTCNWNHISHICCVSNPKFEPERCKMLHELFKEQNIDECFIKYISPTYKHTITQEIYNQHIKSQLVQTMRPNPMKYGELSLFLNYKANLEYIVKNYKDGIFLIFESDILVSKDIHKFNDFLNTVEDKEWDLIHIGMFDNGMYDIPLIKGITGYRRDYTFDKQLIDYIQKNTKENEKYIEDITNVNDEYRLIRKFHTRCADSFLWKYEAVVKCLQWMNTIETNYGSPWDYYLINIFENDIDLKHYWSVNEFFKQGSNLGIIQTTLQN